MKLVKKINSISAIFGRKCQSLQGDICAFQPQRVASERVLSTSGNYSEREVQQAIAIKARRPNMLTCFS